MVVGHPRNKSLVDPTGTSTYNTSGTVHYASDMNSGLWILRRTDR
jgi:hypothetical protein